MSSLPKRSRQLIRKLHLPPLSAIALTFCLNAPAWSNGNFTLIEGDVRVQDAPASATTQVQSGNTVVVGSGSRAVMRMVDGQVIAVSANSRLTIEDFKYQENTPRQGNTLLRLFTGSMRAVSGLIAKAEPRNFRVVTSTATIGIRGTDFLIGIAPDGSIFTQVLDGTVELTSATTSQVASAGQFFTVAPSGAITVGTAASLATTAAQFQSLLQLSTQLVAPVAGAAAGTVSVGAGLVGATGATVGTVFLTVIGAAALVNSSNSANSHSSK